MMKLFIGTYGKHWYSVEYSNNEFSNPERFEGWDHSCICVKDGIPYSISENTEAGPCYLTPVEGTDFFLSSNFGDGSVDLVRFTPHFLQKLQFTGDGPVKERGRQIHSRIHQVLEFPLKGVFPDTGGTYFLATDFGADRIRILELVSTDACEECGNFAIRHLEQYDIAAPAGSGPRHMAFNMENGLLYCLCELSNELLVYRFKGTDAGIVQRIDTSGLGITGEISEYPAAGDLKMHPDGKWLFATRRLSNDGILVFRVRPDGLLEFSFFKTSDKHPRMIHIAMPLHSVCRNNDKDSAMFVACKDGGVQVFPLMESQEGECLLIGEQTARLTLPDGDSPVWVQPC